MKKTCIQCGKEFETKYSFKKTCSVKCSKLRRKQTNIDYRKSDKYKKYIKEYVKSEKYKEIQRIRYTKSEKYKEIRRRYIKSEKFKIRKRFRLKKAVANLDDSYIANLFHLRINQISPELIKLKRLQIKILRECKNS